MGNETQKSGDATKPTTSNQSYKVKKGGHTHKGVVLAEGDSITPKNEAQAKFLRDNGVI